MTVTTHFDLQDYDPARPFDAADVAAKIAALYDQHPQAADLLRHIVDAVAARMREQAQRKG